MSDCRPIGAIMSRCSMQLFLTCNRYTRPGDQYTVCELARAAGVAGAPAAATPGDQYRAWHLLPDTCYLLQLSVQMMHQGSNQNFGLHRMESRAREIPDNFPRGCAGVHIHVI